MINILKAKQVAELRKKYKTSDLQPQKRLARTYLPCIITIVLNFYHLVSRFVSYFDFRYSNLLYRPSMVTLPYSPTPPMLWISPNCGLST